MMETIITVIIKKIITHKSIFFGSVTKIICGACRPTQQQQLMMLFFYDYYFSLIPPPLWLFTSWRDRFFLRQHFPKIGRQNIFENSTKNGLITEKWSSVDLWGVWHFYWIFRNFLRFFKEINSIKFVKNPEKLEIIRLNGGK